MSNSALREWLAEPRPALVAAVADGIREHVDTLKSRGIGYYGYAILPGELYEIHSLVAATNTEADIQVPRENGQYLYYRFSVDEWAHYDQGGFEAANALLDQENTRFKSMHSKPEDDYMMDDLEVAHAEVLLESIIQGIEAAKTGGVFGAADPFLVVWIPDSDDEVMERSVRRLNSAAVATDFLSEFG